MHWPLGHECCWWPKLDSSLLFTSASTYLHPVICVGHWGFPWRNMDSYSDPNCVQKLKGPLGTRVSHQPFCRAQLCHSAATPCQLQAYSSIIWTPPHPTGPELVLDASLSIRIFPHYCCCSARHCEEHFGGISTLNWFLVRKGKMPPSHSGFSLFVGSWSIASYSVF